MRFFWLSMASHWVRIRNVILRWHYFDHILSFIILAILLGFLSQNLELPALLYGIHFRIQSLAQLISTHLRAKLFIFFIWLFGFYFTYHLLARECFLCTTQIQMHNIRIIILARYFWNSDTITIKLDEMSNKKGRLIFIEAEEVRSGI